MYHTQTHTSTPPVVGAQLAAPLWWPIAQPGARLVPLSHLQCLGLLRGSRTGTAGIAFTGTAGPVATTTGYEAFESSVMLGRLPAGVTGLMSDAQLLLVRIDHFDPGVSSGWTVVLVSTAAPGEYLEVEFERLTGRRITAADRAGRLGGGSPVRPADQGLPPQPTSKASERRPGAHVSLAARTARWA